MPMRVAYEYGGFSWESMEKSVSPLSFSAFFGRSFFLVAMFGPPTAGAEASDVFTEPPKTSLILLPKSSCEGWLVGSKLAAKGGGGAKLEWPLASDVANRDSSR
ncbi:hypothetical protein QG37_07622 [Candidozyma auris]|nr:hypothetical protein QG37_07622 [[Candida] auris]